MSRRLSSAATRKQSAPRNVPSVRPEQAHQIADVDGITKAPTAESAEEHRADHVQPRCTASARLRIPQPFAVGRGDDREGAGDEEADRPERVRTPAAARPRASVLTAVISAAVVLRLKKSVPTNWTAAAHQSERSARFDAAARRAAPAQRELDEGGQREEDRADEEGQRWSTTGADGVRVERARRRPRRRASRWRIPTPRGEGGGCGRAS